MVKENFFKKSGRYIFSKLSKICIYKNYDSSTYWRNRAKSPSQAAVLWKNQQYNILYRAIQKEILFPYITNLDYGAKVLDIGCGIGIVVKMLLEMNSNIMIDAVDFSEMISIAKKSIKNSAVKFISCSAEEYCVEANRYDIVLSSGCYSAIRDITKLERALSNSASMLKENGRIIMIDPFHRCNYLARAKYGTKDVVQFLKQFNAVLEEKSGVLFWPFREWLANSNYKGEYLKKYFLLGEKILAALGKHFWADYKVLIFMKMK